MTFLEFDFMRRALVAAAAVGLAAPAVGIFLVNRGLSLMGDGIGHIAFMGVAIGLMAGVAPVGTALVVSVVGAVLLEVMRAKGRAASDVALAILFYGGLAGGALITYLSGNTKDVLAYLFGSILLVTSTELVLILLVAAFVLATVFALRRHLFAVSFDEEVAIASGLPVRALNLVVAVLAALTIAVTMRVVGLLLVSAMLVLPVAAAQRVAGSFRTTLLISLALGTGLSVVGLIVAFYVDVAPGATIVLSAIATFVLLSIFKKRSSGRVAA